jgi:hypothetical protein
VLAKAPATQKKLHRPVIPTFSTESAKLRHSAQFEFPAGSDRFRHFKVSYFAQTRLKRFPTA